MALLNYSPPLFPYIDILYRDDDILVLNKPSGLLSVPGKQLEHKDSLQLRVQRVFPTATIVHRLDMATSGLMIMALNKAAHKHLGLQFERRETGKRYLAWVEGTLQQPSGKVELPLICDWPNRPKQKVDHQVGKPATTFYQLLEQRDDRALLALTPITGRSHQLRVHCLSMGHVILGDRLYATGKALDAASRLQLHAYQLRFKHPTTEQSLHFMAPCPFAEVNLAPLTEQ